VSVVAIAEAARLLQEGQVVAYPTETVYGLGADVRSARALERLHALKGRPREHSVSVLVADLAALEDLVPGLPSGARALAQRFWPGPLTLVLEQGRDVLPLVASERGVGFRCSPDPTAGALARAAGPIASTSANRSGARPARSAAEVEASFGPELPVAGGAPAGGLAPSTVVALRPDGSLELLREGPLGLAELRSITAPSVTGSMP
jgi:L-threonylcarbamoyladenylate synthase